MPLEIKGEGRATSSVADAARRFKAGVRQAARISGEIITKQVIEGMRGAGGGRVYGAHQAGAPGDYPAIRTGGLVGSIDFEVQGVRALRVGSTGSFNGGFDYALGVHEGTSKMPARPYLTLAVEQTEGRVRSILGRVPFRKLVGG